MEDVATHAVASADERGANAARDSRLLDRVERFYLDAVRVILLLAATLLILGTLWYGISGAYKKSRDVTAIKEQPQSVTADDVIATATPSSSKTETPATSLQSQQRYYRDFTNRYFRLFQTGFERYRKPADPRVGQAAFQARFIDADQRLQRIRDGSTDFARDKADLESLLTVMSQAAAKPVTRQRLVAYQRAKRVVSTRIVNDTRSERYCSYYGYYINECISYDYRQVPVQRKVTDSHLPTGVRTPLDWFAAYHGRFIDTLAQRRDIAAAAANGERRQILADNAEGEARLIDAAKGVAAFVALMTLFILIAIERHQRRRERA